MPITRKIRIAAVRDLPEGSSQTFTYGPRKGIILHRGGAFVAYVNACTHMGGTVDLAGNVLRCRQHHAEFDPATGARLSGQAPEGTRLAPIDLTVEDGIISAMLELRDPFED